MDTIRRYSMLIGGDWVDADERRAYPLLLSTPPA